MSSSKSRGYLQDPVDRDQLVETVERLYEEGETITNGVSAYRILEEVEWSKSTVFHHLRCLADEGRLEQSWGFEEDLRQRRTYAPADASGGEGR